MKRKEKFKDTITWLNPARGNDYHSSQRKNKKTEKGRESGRNETGKRSQFVFIQGQRALIREHFIYRSSFGNLDL